MTFLAINGWTIRPDEKNAIDNWLALAAGTLDEDGIATWFKRRVFTG